MDKARAFTYFYRNKSGNDLKNFYTLEWTERTKSFLSKYPCKKHFLRDMITYSSQGYLKTEIGTELVKYYAKINKNAVFNLLISLAPLSNRFVTDLAKDNCLTQEDVFIKIKEFFLNQVGLKKLKKYEFDLTTISQEKQKEIWNVLSNLITDKTIKNSCSIIYESMLKNEELQKESTFLLLDLFLESDEKKIKNIMPDIVASLIDKYYRELFFPPFQTNLPIIHRKFFLLQKVAFLAQKKSTKQKKIKKIINDFTKNLSLTDVNLKTYFQNLFQLCDSNEEELLKKHCANFVKAQKNGDKLVLMYIKDYIKNIHNIFENQTYMRAPLFLYLIQNQNNLSCLEQILSRCERTIKKQNSIGNQILYHIASYAINGLLKTLPKRNIIDAVIQLDQKYPLCFKNLSNFDIITSCFEKEKLQKITQEQLTQFVKLIIKTNYFEWRYRNRVISDETNGCISYDSLEHLSFYEDLCKFFSFIDENVNLLYEWASGTIRYDSIKQESYWHYVLFAWFVDNQSNASNLGLLLDKLQEQDYSLYETFLCFMLPPIGTGFRSATFCTKWPAKFFIQICPDHLMNALRFFLQKQDQVEKYLPALCCLKKKSLSDLFNFIYDNDRQFYIELYETCCKFAIQKNYRIKNLSSVKAPNPIFLYYFNLHGQDYLKNYFRYWRPLPYLTEDLDNTWELSLLPASYNGCLNIPLETSSQVFLDTIQKSPIFLQFFLRFARVKNILHFFLQKNLRNSYVWQSINNKVFLIPSNRLLQERFDVMTEDFYYVFLLSFITHRTGEFLYNYPLFAYALALSFGVCLAFSIERYEKIFISYIKNIYSKLLTICRLNQKRVE